MNDKEAFDAQQEAKKGVAGEVAPSTRERISGGLARYLNTEAQHIAKHPAAKPEHGGKKRR